MSSILLLSRRATRAFLTFGLVAMFAPALVHAGPPLICHPYTIGSAKSLPGSDGSDHWLGISKTYDRKNLVSDTLALLTPDTPVIVRMETPRRAAIYATSEMRGWEKNSYTEEDRRISADLLTALRNRTKDSASKNRALALFDAGFFAETLRQTNLDPGVDGYALLTEAAKLRGPDPEMDFALALASYSPRRKEHTEYLTRARAAAKADSLLASNLATHFSKS